MAPVLPELFSQAVYSFKSYDWSSEALNASEKLAQVASDSNVLSGDSHLCEPHQRTKLISVKKTAAWAWLLGVFASIGAFFATSWQYVGASEVSKEHIWEWFTASWQSLSEFLLRPDARSAIIVWFVVFWICVLIPLALGFGPVGVIGGSLAAWFQSVIYGAFTPAGGFFAVMTSVGMMGVACPPVAVPSMIIASLAAWITWSMSST
ncbi:Interferon-induced 6-16 family, partial [Rhizoctonia solani]